MNRKIISRITIAGLLIIQFIVSPCVATSQAGDTETAFSLPYSGVLSYNGFVFGITNKSSEHGIGIVGSSWSKNGKGINGVAISNLDDAKNYGGYFSASGGKGIGVFGESVFTGWVENYGGYFISHGKYGAGILGEAIGGQGKGVVGKNDEFGYSGYLGGMQFGVEGRHIESGSKGVLGNKEYGAAGQYGQSGFAGYLGTKDYAVAAYGPLLVHGAGMRIENAGGDPVMTIAGPSGWNTDFWGKIVIRSHKDNKVLLELGEGLDYAEGFDTKEKKNILPGSVLIIDQENPGKLKLSDSPYDKKVAGIVSGANGIRSGVTLGVDNYEVKVALAGRVYCNVDAAYGEIKPGDLLTTSPTVGYAMVARDGMNCFGAVLGKAMEGMSRGNKGQILVLVALQ